MMHVVRDGEVEDIWPLDARGWTPADSLPASIPAL
jgi:hypothetical protein